MRFGVKNGLFVCFVVLMLILQNGCANLDLLRTQDTEAEPEQNAEAQAPADPEPAPVIEPFTEQSSGWRPVLPHELDAQFEESEILLKLFRYSRRLGVMTPQQLEQEYRSFKSLAEPQKKGLTAQLQYAMLLSAQSASFRDDEGAKKILSKIINTEKQRGVMLREYAYNLLVAIGQNERAEQQNLLLRKKLKSEIERREALEQKLEALKSIEESITQRQNNPAEVTP
jgi:hypothetical protein